MVHCDDVAVAGQQCTSPVLNFDKITDDYTKLIIAALPLLILGFIALVFVAINRNRLLKHKTGKDIGIPHLDYLAKKIKNGANSFIKTEYKFLVVYCFVWAILLLILFSINAISDVDDGTDGVRTMACFIVGATCSGLSGIIGMSVATDGNVRTTAACAIGTLNNGLQVAFTAGTAMGFGVVGLATCGLTVMLFAMKPNRDFQDSVQYLHAFGMGASSIALFARVAGGIYTKAADVGADLVGKVEAGIDEDDPHNPGVIADNVGDNVGDVCGMGSDLFESYTGSILGCTTLGAWKGIKYMTFPLWLEAAGMLGSLIGFFFVSTNQKGEGWNSNLSALMWALDKGMLVANIIFVSLGVVIVIVLFGYDDPEGWKALACVAIGLATGMLIGKGTEYFTSFDYGPVISIKDRARTGPATVIIQGFGVGMISTLWPALLLATAILACAALSGPYGVACADVGMLATLGMSLSTDAYGPVADNAGGLAEMASLGAEVRAKTDSLDALGNTAAAIDKGFAAGSAVLTSVSLLAAFKEEICHGKLSVCTEGGHIPDVNNLGLKVLRLYEVTDPIILAGVLLGAMLPYLFASLTMLSVSKTAAEMIDEIREQFRTLKNKKGETLMEVVQKIARGETVAPEDDIEPDSDRCVMISTRSSVKEMIAPGFCAVLSPLVIGFLVGAKGLMGLLVGTVGSAAMLAVMMGNAGGAWDNSKKLCEKLKIKKTEQGKACVVGDTVGDPFKDTSGPCLDILLKLMAMISLLMAPLIKDKDDWDNYYFGFIPMVIGIIIVVGLIQKKILTWKDPLEGKYNDSDTKTET